jgi:hypothetical protein
MTDAIGWCAMTSADDEVRAAATPEATDPPKGGRVKTIPIEADSGTGWPSEPEAPAHDHGIDPWASHSPHSTVQIPVAAVPADDPEADGARAAKPKKRRIRRMLGFARSGRRAFWLVMMSGVVVILLLLWGILSAIPHLGNPFKAQTTDRSQPVLLLSIQDLARFEAASGNFQVIVDVQQDRRFIPDIIFSQRSLFVAAGSVDAYVDFSRIGEGDVVASADRKTVTINLPAPQLEPPNLDVDRSYIYAEQEGLINKLQDLVGSDPNKQNQLYQLARQKIAAAAVDSQLGQRAETNTKAMLEGLLKSLGYTTVTINFANP